MSNNFSRDSYGYADNNNQHTGHNFYATRIISWLFFLIFPLQGEVEHSSDLRRIHQCSRTTISHKRKRAAE